MFRVGQKVVCIKSVDKDKQPAKVGSVYTVRGILSSPFPFDNGKYGIYLEEISAGQGRLLEFAYHAEHFRPVQEKGVEMLRAILVHPKSPVKEDA